jgi:molecular chaperone GrpE (heat shock protein)
MWQKLVDLIKEVFELGRNTKQNAQDIQELAERFKEMQATLNLFSERLLRLEIKFDEYEKRTATEREVFRLQIENLILRARAELPLKDEQE